MLAYCGECLASTNHWRVKGQRFRCITCSTEQEIREVDHDRDGLLGE